MKKNKTKNKHKNRSACNPNKLPENHAKRHAYVFVDTENVGFCLPSSFEKGIDLYMYTTNDKTRALYPEYLSGKHIHFLHPKCIDHSSKNELDFCLIADAAALTGSLSEEERARAHIIILSHDRDFDFPIRYLGCRFPDCHFERISMNAAKWFESRHAPAPDAFDEQEIWKESFADEPKREEKKAGSAEKNEGKAAIRKEEKRQEEAASLFDATDNAIFDFVDERDCPPCGFDDDISDVEAALAQINPSDSSACNTKKKKKTKKAKKAKTVKKAQPMPQPSAQALPQSIGKAEQSPSVSLFDLHPNLKALWRQKNNYDEFKRGMTKKVRSSLRVYPDHLENPFVWFEQDPYSQSWLLYYSGSKVGAYPSLEKGMTGFQKYYQKAMLQQRLVKSAKKSTKKVQTSKV